MASPLLTFPQHHQRSFDVNSLKHNTVSRVPLKLLPAGREGFSAGCKWTVERTPGWCVYESLGVSLYVFSFCVCSSLTLPALIPAAATLHHWKHLFPLGVGDRFPSPANPSSSQTQPLLDLSFKETLRKEDPSNTTGSSRILYFAPDLIITDRRFASVALF